MSYEIRTAYDTATADDFDSARLAGATLVADALEHHGERCSASIHRADNVDGHHVATVTASKIGDGYTTHYMGTLETAHAQARR